MKYQRLLFFSCLTVSSILQAPPVLAESPRLLSEIELDQITAGSGEDTNRELATLELNRTTRAGTVVHADGSIFLIEAADRLATGVLQISGNAQNGLSSLINVNAVNSEVNVLLNLNISIDSNIGTINQMNLNSRISPPLPGSP